MTFDQPTLPGIPAVISSEASGSGSTPCDSPGGPTTRRSGPARARASRSALPGAVQERMTLDTSGQSSPASSASAALQLALESRLRARLEGLGSPLYVLTWKEWDMESGPPICALRAQAPRTSGRDCTGWPTARQQDGSKAVRTNAGAMAEVERKGGTQDLDCAAHLAGWPTTSARDWKSSASNMHGENARPLNEVARLAGWATPSAAEMRTMDPERLLERRAECKARQNNGNGFGLTLGNQATLFLAETESGGQLNPAFAAWLMAIPSNWLMVAPAKKRRGRKCSAASGTP